MNYFQYFIILTIFIIVTLVVISIGIFMVCSLFKHNGLTVANIKNDFLNLINETTENTKGINIFLLDPFDALILFLKKIILWK